MKKMTKICVLLTMVMVLVAGAYQALKIHQKEQRQKEFEELFGGEVKTSEVPISVSHREEQKQEESDVSDEKNEQKFTMYEFTLSFVPATKEGKHVVPNLEPNTRTGLQIGDSDEVIFFDSSSLTYLDNGGIKVNLSEVESIKSIRAGNDGYEFYFLNGNEWNAHIEGSEIFAEPEPASKFMGWEFTE